MEDNSIASTATKESVEESGWTAYFEYFSNIYQRKSFSSGSFSCGSSLISDAATTPAAARKAGNDGRRVFSCSSKPPKKSRFKKTRSEEICEDDSLEDTASSPVNRPKVKGESDFDIEEKKMKFDDVNDRRELKKKKRDVFSSFVNVS